MPRLAKKYVNASYHHVMAQGINKEKIFCKSLEKGAYKRYLEKYKVEYNIEIVSYCIMNNHVHLLLYSENIENISKYMHYVNMNYAMVYNRAHDRVGYVFRNRFKSEPIYDSIYLRQCIAYIHNNPVKAKICSKPSEYIYSSYNEILLNDSNLVSIDKIYNSFENLENFKKSHEKIKLNNYLDTSEEKQKFIESEIDDFLIKNNINRENINIKKNVVVAMFVKEVLDKKIISKSALAKYINIPLYSINKIDKDGQI